MLPQSHSMALAASCIAPLMLGALLHGLCMKYGWLAALARPLDGGRRWNGERWFGDNKTWRGIVAVALGTGLGYLLRPLLSAPADSPWMQPAAASFALGLAVGAAAMLAELPNSFIKRRLQIAPGTQSRGALGALFHVIDQIDLLLGAALVLAVVMPIGAPFLLWSALLLFGGHQLVTVIGYLLGMRKTWR